MNHNDVLRSMRYMLKVNDAKIIEIVGLSGLTVSADEVASYMKKEEEEGYVRCPDAVMAHFLDGLVIHRRGRREWRPPRARGVSGGDTAGAEKKKGGLAG